ncbi:hypothetical protein GMES_1044 [Paraglaciecola mesophila KMM 241]|uniref:Glycosyltransferase 2-like domain-containing protein n=1 Tax=Paraglaciecola mesophila KMM 241 TaxID=1128912 RepID=K6Z2Y8_9ALTE|nr:hypothetical protein [Paraglaciecola mesophila]GAC23343.1 hypothetical protein GMES_1044 [Paraglaciecola mesophila KMM 241]
MKISILVVLYSCEAKNSQTINTLISSGGARNNVQLIIWNNGPELLEDTNLEVLRNEGFEAVKIIETTNNIALSKIYNDFIKKWPSSRYIMLDHDSTLNKQYVDLALEDESIEIGVPLITVDGEVKSPSMDIRKGHEDGPYNHKDRIVGIGSGIVLSESAILMLKNRYTHVFDERFYLYAVDTTFFFRVRDAGLNEKLKLIHGFEHSLSRLEVESNEKAMFRKIERSCAIGLCTRFYFLHCKTLFLKIIAKKILGRDTFLVKTIISSIFSGRHYRSSK